jgi:hypothetical protein
MHESAKVRWVHNYNGFKIILVFGSSRLVLLILGRIYILVSPKKIKSSVLFEVQTVTNQYLVLDSSD